MSYHGAVLPTCTFPDEYIEDERPQQEPEIDDDGNALPLLRRTKKSNTILLRHHKFDVEEHNQKWVDYVKTRLGFSDRDQEYMRKQESRPIANHHMSAGITVGTWLMTEGTILLYQVKNEIVPVRITKQLSGDMRAVVVGEDEEEDVFTPVFKNIVVDIDMAEKAMNRIRREYDVTPDTLHFYAIRDFQEAQPFQDMVVWQVIKPGEWVEVQLVDHVEKVALAQVIRNHRGLLLIKALLREGTFEQFWIHMFDKRLHEVTWTVSQNSEELKEFGPYTQKVEYIQEYTPELRQEAFENAAPAFVFCCNVIVNHRLNPGDIVVVTNGSSTKFYYAHVLPTDSYNKHWFFLAFGTSIISNGQYKPTYFHLHDPRIFGSRKIRDAGIHIVIPSDMQVLRNENDRDAYRRIYCPGGRFISDIIGSSLSFTDSIRRKWPSDYQDLLDDMEHTLKYVEVLRPTMTGSLQLTAAVVTGVKDHIVRMKTCMEDEPCYLHADDLNLFQFGSCNDMNLAIAFEGDILSRHAREKHVQTATNGFANF